VIRRVRARRTLTRIHLWLGCVIGVPLLFWTVSGLWMAARPIEEVRAEARKAKPRALILPQKITAPLLIRPAKSITLEQRVTGPQWTIAFADGGFGRASPITGDFLPRVNASEAGALAKAAVSGTPALESVRFFAANANPLDLRRERPAWQAHFADGLNVYIDAESGSVLAFRTGQWRLYDWMWGLHIMDLQGREATSHFILILFAGLAALETGLALVLLLIASWRRKPEGR
jgi:PepSY-associated TM region